MSKSDNSHLSRILEASTVGFFCTADGQLGCCSDMKKGVLQAPLLARRPPDVRKLLARGVR